MKTVSLTLMRRLPVKRQEEGNQLWPGNLQLFIINTACPKCPLLLETGEFQAEFLFPHLFVWLEIPTSDKWYCAFHSAILKGHLAANWPKLSLNYSHLLGPKAGSAAVRVCCPAMLTVRGESSHRKAYRKFTRQSTCSLQVLKTQQQQKSEKLTRDAVRYENVSKQEQAGKYFHTHSTIH